MKHYEVVYGNEIYRSWVGVRAKDVKDARRQVEKNLKNGLSIIEINEI
jgi:hypothetical protein|nr:MAG TPA: hypothetical protein [Caudoviricetes sp.]